MSPYRADIKCPNCGNPMHAVFRPHAGGEEFAFLCEAESCDLQEPVFGVCVDHTETGLSSNFHFQWSRFLERVRREKEALKMEADSPCQSSGTEVQ